MPRFYLKTDDGKVTGPFTGLELREAALARLVLPDTEVANTADGPWAKALDVGLFLDKNVPLPHPSENPLPKYRLSGVNEAFEGPFELRELVDFAVRKILPRDALIQPDGRLDKIPVSHFRILDACLRGELSRNSNSPPPVSPNVKHDPTSPPVTTSIHNADLMADPSEDLDSIVEEHRKQARKNVQNKAVTQSKPRSKIVYAGLALGFLVIGALAWWITQPPASQTNRSAAIGSWVLIPNDEKGNAFGVSFGEDGACLIFNSNGECWSGNFEWFDDAIGEAGVQSGSPVSGKDPEIPSHHYRSEVQASDGFVRLESESSSKQPMFGDKPIRECFLRQEGQYLWLGYLVNVNQTGGNKTQDVAWVSLWPRRHSATIGKVDTDMRGTDLLDRYGVPDEVRSLQPLEITANSDRKSAEPRSLVRYGTTNLTLFADGSVRRFKAPKASSTSP